MSGNIYNSGGGGGYYGGGGGGTIGGGGKGAGGGSGFTGGCISSSPIISAQGSSGTASGTALPAYTTDPNYVSGVGVGSAGTTSGVLPLAGGDGLVWIQAMCCGSGWYLPVTGTSCVVCPAGKFSLAGATVCSVCPAGKYASGSGSPLCLLCPAGEWRKTELDMVDLHAFLTFMCCRLILCGGCNRLHFHPHRCASQRLVHEGIVLMRALVVLVVVQEHQVRRCLRTRVTCRT